MVRYDIPRHASQTASPRKRIFRFATGILTSALCVLSLAARQPPATPPAVTAARTVMFTCDDKSILTIEFSTATGDIGQAKVIHGSSTWTLPQVRSGSGARFAATGVSVWNKGNDVLFEDGKVTRNCAATPAARLAGSSWRLVEIQSSDDRIGTTRPDDPAKYTLTLGADGRAAMRLNCNHGTGPWSATPTGTDSGSFSLGPLAVTRALCPRPSLDDRIARDAQYIRSYLLRDGRLYLNLMADGGTYVWETINSR